MPRAEYLQRRVWLAPEGPLRGLGPCRGEPCASNVSRIFSQTVASVYPLYLGKVERKGRTQGELDEVIMWLTGFDEPTLHRHLDEGTTFSEFFSEAALNENASLITGVVCGVRVENVEDPLMQKIRYCAPGCGGSRRHHPQAGPTSGHAKWRAGVPGRSRPPGWTGGCPRPRRDRHWRHRERGPYVLGRDGPACRVKATRPSTTSTPPTTPPRHRPRPGRHQLISPTDNPNGVRSAYLRDPDGSLFSVYRFTGP